MSTRLIYGAIAGVMGAACMTVVRMTARRRGVIEKTVPQAAEEWLAGRIGSNEAPPALHHLADSAMHLGYGATLGACFGATIGRRSGALLPRGVGFGIATWMFGSWLLLPLLGAKGAPWRQSVAENGVDMLAHLTYGIATAVVAQQMHEQPDRGARSKRSFNRVG